MDFSQLLQKFPKESVLLLTITSTAFGWIVRNIFQLIFEKKKYWREQRTFFWKEKIEASKKASEFYLEYLNLINLIIIQIKLYKEEKIEHNVLISTMEQEVNFYSNKLKQFPHFEHHHINLFFDFNQDDNLKIINDNFLLFQKVTEFSQAEILDIGDLNLLFNKLEQNYTKLYANYLNFLETVRKDLENYI